MSSAFRAVSPEYFVLTRLFIFPDSIEETRRAAFCVCVCVRAHT